MLLVPSTLSREYRHEKQISLTNRRTGPYPDNRNMDNREPEYRQDLDNSIMVEYRAVFSATGQEEAEELLHDVYHAVQDIVCPTDDTRQRVCGNCNGTLVNPDLDEEELAELEEWDEDGEWLPGAPCAQCSDSDTPGIEYPCARNHDEYAAIWNDGEWRDSEDRHNRSFYTEILQTWDIDGPDAARALIEHALIHLTD